MNKYYAANGIDEYVKQTFFPNKTNGYFIDIGAHDGVSANNTFYFENEGWNGICFEPIKNVFEKLKENRKCKLVNKALSDKVGEEKFLLINGYSEMLSGLVKEYHPNHINRINNEIQHYNQQSEYIDVVCSTFKNEINETNIDLLSIDTEGSEFTIIKSIDFNKYNISVMVIEYAYENLELLDFLYQNNFEIEKQIAHDIILKNTSFSYIS